MQSFFAKLSDMQLFSIEEADLAELSVEMMEEIMLNLKNVKIEIVTEDNIIKEIAWWGKERSSWKGCCPF